MCHLFEGDAVKQKRTIGHCYKWHFQDLNISKCVLVVYLSHVHDEKM